MGCIGSRNAYAECSYTVESQIRDWEVRNGTFDVTFHDLISRINLKMMVNKEPIRDFSNIIHYFNLNADNIKEANFKTLLSNSYFKTGEAGKETFETENFKLLLFLLTRSLKNATDLHDKTQFLFSYLKNSFEIMDSPINREETNFEEFIKDLIFLSCDTLVNAYFTDNKMEGNTSELSKLAGINNKIFEIARNEIFYGCENGLLTFDQLNKKFDKDQWFMCSGWFREIGLNILNNKVKVPEPVKKEENKDDKKEKDDKKDKE